jgi:hypothetical protein
VTVQAGKLLFTGGLTADDLGYRSEHLSQVRIAFGAAPFQCFDYWTLEEVESMIAALTELQQRALDEEAGWVRLDQAMSTPDRAGDSP